MNNTTKNRRIFIKNTLLGAASLASTSLLSACSSFDDFFFEDRRSYKDEVVIIGGGVSGLYLAYKLRSSSTEFRIFEGSNYIGGRVKSYNGSDYGASLLSSKDVLAQQLVKELSLESKAVDKDYFYLSNGMQELTDTLFERTVGLIPYRSYRLRWKISEIEKTSSGYELVFSTPSGGLRRFSCKKLALAIPPSQWISVTGLFDLPEMRWAPEWLETLQVENTIKLILPSSSITGPLKPYQLIKDNDIEIRQIIKKNKTVPSVEIDIRQPSSSYTDLDAIQNLLKNKLQITYPFQKLAGEQYFDWLQVKLIRGSAFKNEKAIPEQTSNNFQVIGDFTPLQHKYTIEGALMSAKRASELLL